MIKIDPYLKGVLANFLQNYFANRAKAFANEDFEKLREELAQIRERSLGRNQELVAQFSQEAEKLGSKVLLAKDSQEANQQVLTILKKHQATKLVKSKSMVSEETGLNSFLEANGIEVQETDLGEWIIQLARHRPSHMVLPAIHLSRKDVAEIFSEKLGKIIPPELGVLVKTAREELRKEIFTAQAGLTGANALIAENGAMLMLTNEGNGRLVSTIPPVHIAFTTIEKIYADLREALVLLRMLPKNATGQLITSYVSLIAGPHQSAQYIILLDNHRSELMKDSVFRSVLRCIKCSACLNICPVYQQIGGRQFSYVYMGGIGALFTAWIHGLAQSRELASLCLNCRRCDEICSVKIEISRLILALREKLNQELGKPFFKNLLFDHILAHQGIHQNLLKAIKFFNPIIKTRENFIHQLPPPFHKYDHFRPLPAPAPKRLSKLWKIKSSSTIKSEKLKKQPLQLYPGCLIEYFYPEIALCAKQVLNQLGYEVNLVKNSCCGFPAQNAGFKNAGEKALTQLLKKNNPENLIITLCPTCTEMLKSPAFQFKEKVWNFSQFLFEKNWTRLKELSEGKKINQKITYHESCHQKYSLHASEASRQILRLLSKENFIELSKADSCCGFAGTFSLEHPEVSEALVKEKIEDLKYSKAELVVLDCPGCFFQIQGACFKTKLKVRVLHLSQFLAQFLNLA